MHNPSYYKNVVLSVCRVKSKSSRMVHKFYISNDGRDVMWRQLYFCDPVAESWWIAGGDNA